jgi:DNA-binding winged helix-turn-helix (wHTH) protein/Tfp pilus assembly protein PilF
MIAALNESPWVYIFGPFQLDPTRGLLSVGSEIVPLPRRLFEILLALIRANGALVSREALYSHIWPEGGVPVNNLSQHVYMLRRILGERAEDRRYIETVHDRGFRFIAPVAVARPARGSEPPSERYDLKEEPVPSLDVFRGYSRGYKLLEYATATNLRSAIENFEKALGIDPRYVPALVGTAKARLLLSQNGYCAGRDEFPKAKDAIIRALQIAPACAPAHAVLSNIILFCDWNWREAKRELDTALKLNSESACVRASAVWLYAWAGQPAQAITEIQRAIMIEPASPGLQLMLGRVLVDSGDYTNAIKHLSDLIETDPELASTSRRYRAEALLLNGQSPDAILDLLLLPQDRAEDLASRLPLLARAYADNGDNEKAREVYDVLVGMAHTDRVAYSNLVPVALGLGLRSHALDHFDKALKRREPMLPLLRHSPWLSSIRRSDLYRSLLSVLGPIS